MIIYNLSILLVLITLHIKKVNILSPAYFLLLFNTLYTYAIYFGRYLNIDLMPLLQDLNLIIIHMYISASVNIALMLAYIVFFKNNNVFSDNFKYFTIKQKFIFSLLYYLL